MRLLLLLLPLFIAVGCATIPSVSYETRSRLDGEYYGNWRFLANESIFDGKYYQSVSSGLLGGRLKVVTFVDSGSYIKLENGDSYICGSLYDYVDVTFIFDDGAERYETRPKVSEDNKSIIFRTEPTFSKLINAFDRYDNVVIRTQDECGSTIDMIFQIEGETHLKIIESR